MKKIPRSPDKAEITHLAYIGLGDLALALSKFTGMVYMGCVVTENVHDFVFAGGGPLERDNLLSVETGKNRLVTAKRLENPYAYLADAQQNGLVFRAPGEEVPGQAKVEKANSK